MDLANRLRNVAYLQGGMQRPALGPALRLTWARIAFSSLMMLSGVIALHQQSSAGQPVSARLTVAQSGFTAGQIKKIDTDRGLVTLKHGPIESLGMPDMTMIYRLAQPEQIEGFKVGDHVFFKVGKVRGTLVLVELTSLPKAPNQGHGAASGSAP